MIATGEVSEVKSIECFCPEETTALLPGPERGFYSILGYKAADNAVVPEISVHENDTLVLVEINLCNYVDGPISAQALQGIRELFEKLRLTDCSVILRFLYDWDGRNLSVEPKSLDTILYHMEQLGPILRENADRIYLLQGLFIGNWGEMHGSRYLRSDCLKKLYDKLHEAAGDGVRLSVRTPALWRSLTDSFPGADGSELLRIPGDAPALFNDGMLGSESDYGTYGGAPTDRERELAFQNILCREVPNGGEVVGEASWSDAPEAMQTLARMHVSYLNRLFDERTLDKWRYANVSGSGIWDGMNYFDYAQAHLGYRFVIRGVKMNRSLFTGTLSAKITVENVGFAPIYHSTVAELIFTGENGEYVFPMDGDLTQLVQGDRPQVFTVKLPDQALHLAEGEYDIFFRLRSLKYNAVILTANQGSGSQGCPIGRCVSK